MIICPPVGASSTYCFYGVDFGVPGLCLVSCCPAGGAPEAAPSVVVYPPRFAAAATVVRLGAVPLPWVFSLWWGDCGVEGLAEVRWLELA